MINQEQITVREVNSEINVWLGRNHPTRLSALQEGAKILAREVLREQAYIERNPYRKIDDNIVPPSSESNG